MATEKDLRGDRTIVIPVGATAAGTAANYVGTVPFNATITAARWIPSAAITANGTNYFTLSFYNRGSGAGTTQFATARSYAATNGVKATPESLTLSATSSDLNVTAGDVITVEVTHSGSGLAEPGGVVHLTVRGR